MTASDQKVSTGTSLYELPELVQPFIIEGCYAGAIQGGKIQTGEAGFFDVFTPITGKKIAKIGIASEDQLQHIIDQAQQSFRYWRRIPAPKRGELVLEVANLVRKYKDQLAHLITLEMGKVLSEAEGEVQEWIDMCDFAVGLSRQLYGLTIASERPQHRLMEQWHPLGVVGVITAFNFPMAVWAWNAMIALVCGNTLVWKPSEKTPLCALACHSILLQALEKFPAWSSFSAGLSAVVIGDGALGRSIALNGRVPLVSATGSVEMGRSVAKNVATRLGRSLLELGGNNAMVITPSADLSLAIRAVVFSAVGTSGQRCTSLRRLFVHESQIIAVMDALKNVYRQIKIGNPLDGNTLVGPLIDEGAWLMMHETLQTVLQAGAEKICGGDRIQPESVGDLDFTHGCYVTPAIVKIEPNVTALADETFAPLLYVISYKKLEDAVRWNNQVSQGLSSAIFTNDVREAEFFMSSCGADTGLVNVNIGTSGAEIGGAFGGEKDTGGGRESGSDAWKSYMRRATNTINYGLDLPLAQGIKFDF